MPLFVLGLRKIPDETLLYVAVAPVRWLLQVLKPSLVIFKASSVFQVVFLRSLLGFLNCVSYKMPWVLFYSWLSCHECFKVIVGDIVNGAPFLWSD